MVGIGVGAMGISPSAQLEIKSTNRGLLLPRMTHTQRDAIASSPRVWSCGALLAVMPVKCRSTMGPAGRI